MTTEQVAQWMQAALVKDGCLYQDDVVDHLIKSNDVSHLTINSEGNEVLGRPVLNAFLKLNREDVVWVKSGFYWRFRVAEDEPARIARG
ncbi:hypothetical protein C1N58_02430 [Pantoea sp. SGAir0180]|uniref:DUF6953 family protein n=1 Tax=Pantoea ananas TaxID=553 RepID=UPI000B5F3678|nr:hypothetical protein [Pantoea ananatis]ASN14908.1 hypothetical protein B7764_06805 [Pantoea ananatis]